MLDFHRKHLEDELQHFSASDAPPMRSRDPFILSSCLQKSLRRGDRGSALSSARTLTEIDPPRVWKRLVTIVFEDFGLSSVESIAQTVAAAADKSWRRRSGRDQLIASYLIDKLLTVPRDRRVDDLYMLAVRLVTYPASRSMFIAKRPSLTIIDLVSRAEEIIRACEQEIPHRSFRGIRASRCDVALNNMGAAGIANSELLEICVQSRRSSMCLLPVLFPLVKNASDAVWVNRSIASNPVPPACDIDGVPSYALDGYTRVGKEALLVLARLNRDVSTLLQSVRGQTRSNALQYLLFEVEGGVCTREVSDPVRDELKRLAYGCWTGFPQEMLPEAFATIRDAIPELNSIRKRLSVGQRDLFTL